MNKPTERTTCVVVGGGPAGMFLGLLLARAGVEVTVLEKHNDFLRDFRGDTVHPTTLKLLDELGLGERFAELPQSKLDKVGFAIDAETNLIFGDMARLKVDHPYVAMVPQWDLLDLLAEAGKAESTFTLRMNTEVTGLLRESGRVTGVHYRTADGTDGELHADLTVGTDGRWSIVRRLANLKPKELPVRFDAWWFRLPRYEGDQGSALTPQMRNGHFGVLIPREGYYQIAYLAPKGTDARLRAKGIESFRRDIADLVPWFAGRVDTLESMDDVKFLEVRLNRLRRWHDKGVLCIGDAAHAMSPMGGVGINLAVQDAVATAHLLAGPLLRGQVTPKDLAKVRRRRLTPTFLVQVLQRGLQHLALMPVLAGKRNGPPPGMARLFTLIPQLSFFPAYLIGIGFRPEHAPDFAKRQA